MKPKTKKRMTIKALAQRRCDAARRRCPHLVFFLNANDPPCKSCLDWARAKLKGG